MNPLWDLRVETLEELGSRGQQQTWIREAWLPRLTPSLTCEYSHLSHRIIVRGNEIIHETFLRNQDFCRNKNIA